MQEEFLSRNLLQELGAEIVAKFVTGDDPVLRVDRSLDMEIARRAGAVTFIVGDSGSGKTVACIKALQAHVAANGLAVIVQHKAIEDAQTLDQALITTLKQFKPTLVQNQSPISFSRPEDPLLILVEDVSRSREPRRIIEKLAGWLPQGSDETGWRLLCPVWPHFMNGLGSQVKILVDRLSIRPPVMSTDEAASAVFVRARSTGAELDTVESQRIAVALGNDPLLIALNNDWKTPRPERTIGRFVEDVLERVEADAKSGHSIMLASELNSGLRCLGQRMLVNKRFEPSWNDIASWGIPSADLVAVKAIALQGELVSLSGSPSAAKLVFRHDRVRDWILVDAAESLFHSDELEDAVLGDPFLAEVMAALLVRSNAPERLTSRIRRLNPLALFHSIRLAPEGSAIRASVAKSAKSWISKIPIEDRATFRLRWECMAAIYDVDGPFMHGLLRHFPREWHTVMIARLRNGDLEGGIEFCLRFDLDRAVGWLSRAVLSARVRFGDQLTEHLIGQLNFAGSDNWRLRALLRLSGIWSEPALAPVLLQLWRSNEFDSKCLGEFLWALASTATPDNSEELLNPVCDAWAALPIERNGERSSPRDDLAAHSIRNAFQQQPPVGALSYFFKRAAREDLAWQIEYMLSPIDHPEVIEFHVLCGAARRKTSSNRYFDSSPARRHWELAAEGLVRPMTDMSRSVLEEIWARSNAEDHARVAAFDLWATARMPKDLSLLRAYTDDSALAERIFSERLKRGDTAAIPEMITRLDRGEMKWWHFTRYVWSNPLLEALERQLSRVAEMQGDIHEGEPRPGLELTRVILNLRSGEATRLLMKFWPAMGRSTPFILAALHLATPDLVAKAAVELRDMERPEEVFEQLTMYYGLNFVGGSGITRVEQIEVLEPYLDYFTQNRLEDLARECNKLGLFDIRRRLLDPRIMEILPGMEGYPEKVFNRNLEFGRATFVDHEVDDMFKSGTSWHGISDALTLWLRSHDENVALEIAAGFVATGGNLRDVDLLKVWPGDNIALQEAVIADTGFIVSRRAAGTLN